MVGKVGKRAGYGVATGEVFGLEHVAIGGEDEFGLVAGGGRAASERSQSRACLPLRNGGKVDVAGLQQGADGVGAAQVAFVGFARLQAPDGGFLVAKCQQKGVGELGSIKGLQGKFGNGGFDFDGVHVLGSGYLLGPDCPACIV